MTASGKKLLKSKDPIDDIMPYDIWKFPKPIANIVAGYTWDTPLQKPCMFSDVDYTLEKILFLIKHAESLDEFKALVTRCIKNESAKKEEKYSLIDKSFSLDGVQGTLVQLLVSQLDVTIRNKKGDEIDKGMAETFIDIIAALLPHKLQQVQKQAQMAAPIEDAKAREERESKNFIALHQVFNAIKQNDQTIKEREIKTFKEFVKNKRSALGNDKGYLTDNRYYIDHIHLIYGAFRVLAKRGKEFPPTNNWDSGRTYGSKASRFCMEIIGALQFDLPSRMRQILSSGLYYVLNRNQKSLRSISVSGDLFRGIGTNYLLGISSYYDDTGQVKNNGMWQSRLGDESGEYPSAAERTFRTYYEQLQQFSKYLLQSKLPQGKQENCLIM